MSTTRIPTATSSSSIADILERVLDMGVVIAGDIRIKLVDIELLTIQIRLVVCSIEKAREIGMDWWNVALDKGGSKDTAAQANFPSGSFARDDASELAMRLEAMERRMKDIERVGTKSK
jgi:Gas vesicle protein